jgi:hypothetical protein
MPREVTRPETGVTRRAGIDFRRLNEVRELGARLSEEVGYYSIFSEALWECTDEELLVVENLLNRSREKRGLSPVDFASIRRGPQD